jgi:hypothetical protein
MKKIKLEEVKNWKVYKKFQSLINKMDKKKGN